MAAESFKWPDVISMTVYACFSAVACAILLAMSSPSEAKDETSFDAGPLTLQSIARDWERWAGKSPEKIRWAPDGVEIHFDWNPKRDDLGSVYAVSMSEREPRQLDAMQLQFAPPPEPTGSHAADDVDWNRSRTAVTFANRGDIYYVQEGSRNRRLTSTSSRESSPRMVTGRNAVTYQVANNLILHDLDSGHIVELTNFGYASAGRVISAQELYLERQQQELFDFVREAKDAAGMQRRRDELVFGAPPAFTALKPGQRTSDMTLASGGRYVWFSLVDDTQLANVRAVEYPRYVTADGFVDMKAVGSDAPPVKPVETFRQYVLGRVDVTDGSVVYADSEKLGKAVSWNPVVQSPDERITVAWAGSLDHKDAWLCLIDAASGSARVLFHDHDDAWLRGFRGGRSQRGDGMYTGLSADGRTAYFLSESDGWYHLYAVDTDGGAVRQLTKGSFEVSSPKLSSDGKAWYFLSNEGDPLQRHVYTMPTDGGKRIRLTPGEGWVEEYAVSPDERHIAYTFGDPVSPMELFVIPTKAGSKPVQKTHSTSQEFDYNSWQKPEYVSFPDKYGWIVHGELYRPKERSTSRPALIHVHGTGWTQGVAKRFGAYTPETRLEFQFLAEHGYTVLSIDYKGSRGYGRESRTSVYKRTGVPEQESMDAAVEFLVKHHDIDRRRIGLYGHSYGGYLTLMGLLTRPGTFAAGAAQAPNSDSAHAPTWLLMSRLMGTPWENEGAYRRSSPIYHAGQLQDPLLIIHGLEDLNVPIQSTFRLAQRFIELGKSDWDLAVYPAEAHTLKHESSRLDMLRRRFSLFEQHVKGVMQ